MQETVTDQEGLPRRLPCTVQDVDVADDLTKPERLHTQDALRERFGYKDRLRTFVLPLKT